MADEPLTLDLLNRRLEDQAAFIAHETAMYREQIKQQDQNIAHALALVMDATAKAQGATQEATVAAQGARLALDNLKAWVADVVTEKIRAQWHEWVSYSDPRLLNVIYNRVLTHLYRLGVKDTSAVKRATPEDYI